MLDDKCKYRPCYQWGLNKGTFVNGRGYTSYYKVPREVCMTNLLHGCPDAIPEIEIEKAMCCSKPEFAKSRGARRQRCRNCRQWASGWLLEVRREFNRNCGGNNDN